MADFGTLIEADWNIDRSTKVISYEGNDHSGSPTYAKVIDFHRWLQSLADDPVASGDDELDITNTDPSRRSTDNIITLINGYTLDETPGTPAFEHLYDGSIIQDDGDTIFDGIVNFGNTNVQIQILQDGAVLTDDWWNYNNAGLNADDAQGISHRFMIKTRADGVDIDGRRIIGTTRVMDSGAGTNHFTFGEFKINGTSRGNNVLALTSADDLNNSTAETTIAGWSNITNTPGLNLIDVNADGTSEEYYSAWTDDDTPDRAQNDFYERLKWLTRDGSTSELYGLSGEVFRGITHSLAWDAEAGSAVGTNNDTQIQYYVWGTNVVFNTGVGTFTVGEAVVEDTATPQWKGRVLAYTGVGATGSLIIAVEEGTVETGDAFTGATSGATASVNGTPTAVSGGGVLAALAIDDNTGSGNLYVQVLKGAISGDNALLYYMNDNLSSLNVANYLTQAGASSEKSVSTPFVGVSTGSNIIGAYGVGITTGDINDSDILTALDGNTYSRPNLVTNTVSGLTFSGNADYVIVAPWDGSSRDANGDPAFDKDQLSLSGNLTADNITSLTVQEVIPADTPSSGYIRVTDDNGFERRLHYSGWDTSTFTIDTTDGNEDFGTVGATSGANVYVTYLDQPASAGSHSFQVTYSSPRDLVALVRNGGTAPIKQFIAEWSISSANQTLNAIRTTDV